VSAGRVVLAVHGGAGGAPADLASKDEAERALAAALGAGWTVLAGGGPALDAVETAVAAMEASGCFNAGRGAVPDRDGGVSLDAAIMDGPTRAAGAVAAVERLAGAIAAARLVMNASPHVLLAGPGG
jgi:beta-aspartyl-peptidase (threonine type)